MKKMSEGVEIYDTVTFPVEIKQLGEKEFEITLHQGMKRQIREMCKAVGLHVDSLKRIYIGNVGLGDLREGEFRELFEAEVLSFGKDTE